MTTPRWIKIALIVSIGLNVGLAAPPLLMVTGVIDPPHPPGHPILMGGPGPGDIFVVDVASEVRRLADALDLDDNQRQRLEHELPGLLGPPPELRGEVEDFQGRLFTQLILRPDDDASVEELAALATRHHDAAFRQMTQRLRAVARELTPEQRTRLLELMNERREHLLGQVPGGPPPGQRAIVMPLPPMLGVATGS